ncbi:protein mono-ADP-ribosyltransferase PARP11-like isoform X2 [Patiria miniata]|uniref:Poly [ADP-ribose] polymerase n=1 Tax=Patiria miniata TaxID=46514 RepID=A0A914BS52_PATMI|nr:protein mono-ADP-ribosyltransferase PARP11-like isoform X2 [Patiria miniata]
MIGRLVCWLAIGFSGLYFLHLWRSSSKNKKPPKQTRALTSRDEHQSQVPPVSSWRPPATLWRPPATIDQHQSQVPPVSSWRPPATLWRPPVTIDQHQSQNPPVLSWRPPATTICIFNLRGMCAFGNNCRELHSEQHYQWQYSADNGQTWTNFGDNVAIEETYCNIRMEGINIQELGVIRTLFFETMKWSQMDVRRLEIQLTNTSDLNSWQSVLATKWQWYFLDNGNIWMKYTNRINTKVEEAYQMFLSTGQDPTFEFWIVGSHRYMLYFQRMVQRNKNVGTVRKVRRRPKFVTEDMGESCLKLPKYWESNLASADPLSNFVRRKLDPRLHEEECRMVIGHFAKEIDANSFLAIKRVQNIELWREFSKRRDLMQDGQEDSSKAPVELMLFHGTEKQNIEAICQENFDPSLHGTNVGAKYGQGSYFSKSAKYSDAYASPDYKGRGHMFLVRVLVGSYTRGDPKYCWPPLKEPNGLFFDSCVDDPSNPKIFVIFDQNQVYPEYLITYEK